MIQTMLADSVGDLATSRLLVRDTAWDLDQGLDPREKISMVKVDAAESAGRIVG